MKHIIDHANNYIKQQLPEHSKLTSLYEGNVVDHALAVLQTELSAESLKVASKRIPGINILNRITKKLSTVYKVGPKRQTLNPEDQAQFDQYLESMEVDNSLRTADTLLNLNRSFALEPYVDQGKIKLRVLSPEFFTVYSDSLVNPNEPTHFIKLMGSIQKGKNTVNILWIYTSQELTVAHSDGDIISVNENPYGQIPFVVGKANSFKLQPEPNKDDYSNALIIPRQLADLNHATQYQSWSRVYGIDIDGTKVNIAPDAMTIFQSKEGENSKPQIGMISPTVDVDKVLSLITFTLSQMLETRGIKAGAVGTLTPANAASGISKIIDEADTQSVVSENRSILQNVERKLWNLVGVIHNTHVATDLIEATIALDEPFHVNVTYPQQEVLPNPQEQRDTLKFQLENKLTTKRRALKQLNPEMNDKEIDQFLLEIEQESNTKPTQPTETTDPIENLEENK